MDPVILGKERLEEFQSHLMLFFTGFSRIASEIAKSKIDNMKSRAAELHLMKEMAYEAIATLQSNAPIDEIGRMLDQNWKYKRSLSDKVSTSEIDADIRDGEEIRRDRGQIAGCGRGGLHGLFSSSPSSRTRSERRSAS